MAKMLPSDRTKLFTGVFKDAATFLNDWKTSGVYDTGIIKDESVSKLYYLLYARWGNSAIASTDIEQWKYKIWSLIYQYGPNWEKRLDVQKTLRELSEEELKEGSKTINNLALNPSTDPSTETTEEIRTVNQQTVYKNRNSKLGGYARLLELLDEDVTRYFLDKFKSLFAIFVKTRPTLYVVDDEEEEE